MNDETLQDDILKQALLWTREGFDPETNEEVRGLIDGNDEKELEDRFGKNLEFGTGGMRGVMAAGTNRMNVYTVGRATQGLANYLLAQYPDAGERGVCIAYDSRNNSRRFAEEAARVLAANGIRVFIFSEIRPTPLLSFCVRHLGCVSGIVVTASHNPKEYNGYKVYSPFGNQVVAPEDSMIVESVNRVEITRDVKRIEFSRGLQEGIIREIDGDVEKEYLDRVQAFAERVKKGMEEEIGKAPRDVTVVYTPLHGVGITLVPKALESVGGVRLLPEPEQSIPNGDFPTTVSPNPEEKEALERAVSYAEREKADLVIATDPDCDRLGCAVPDPKGGYALISGNQLGVLFTHMILSSYSSSGLMPPNPVVISTIVSTDLAKPIAKDFGVEEIDVLTGFKFIGQKMREFDEKGNKSFIYGFEESYGYLADTFVRDKDGVIASVLALLLVRYAKARFGGVLSYLHFLYERYGLYNEFQRSFYLKGVEGAERIQRIMAGLRSDPPLTLGGGNVTLIKDFKLQVSRDVKSGETRKITDIQESNVLQFYTDTDIKISIRPSGTEPKIKFYFGLNAPLGENESATRAMLDERYRKVSGELFSRCGLDEGR
ncbi:MAG TPA: phospho-sugar mutase [Spirochaetota bacterium]|nr:phospho-sugar mutase [Spirochaetota bacterium]